MSISVEQAIHYMLELTPTLGIEQVPLEETLGRNLAEDLYAQYAQPPFDRSPLDGYAVRASDLTTATPTAPVTLCVVDKLYAGSVTGVSVKAGQAVRLMTGSMIPDGADCVIRQEDTDFGNRVVRIFQCVSAGSNVCRQGEEYRAGGLLLSKGQKIDAATIAVAAGAGYRTLPVRRKVKAVILSTGDELQQPGEPLHPGQVYDSNGIYLKVCLQQMGTDVLDIRSVGDNVGRIAAAISHYVGVADLILTTGGVSVGEKDLMETAVLQIGGRIIFHGLSMKPGMPTMLSEKNGTLILSLSGNPFSAAVPFLLLVRPMLARMLQDPAWGPHWIIKRAVTSFEKSSPTRRFLRGIYSADGVVIPSKQANSQMCSMVGCNCLIDLPAGSSPVQVGDALRTLAM